VVLRRVSTEISKPTVPKVPLAVLLVALIAEKDAMMGVGYLRFQKDALIATVEIQRGEKK
jgi:hypothetical protein